MDDKHPSSLESLLSPTREPDKDLDDLAHAVIGAAIEVHRELGPGLREPIYDIDFNVPVLKSGLKRIVLSS